jgi:hypothetical protein
LLIFPVFFLERACEQSFEKKEERGGFPKKVLEDSLSKRRRNGGYSFSR